MLLEGHKRCRVDIVAISQQANFLYEAKKERTPYGGKVDELSHELFGTRVAPLASRDVQVQNGEGERGSLPKEDEEHA